jgi:hypothetical protein
MSKQCQTILADDLPPVKSQNQFQFSKSTLLQMLKTQIGTTGSAPIAALNGQWDAPDRFTFTIIEVKKDAPFVAVSFCDDGRFLDCTPAFFMRSDVHVNWKPIDEDAYVIPDCDLNARYPKAHTV